MGQHLEGAVGSDPVLFLGFDRHDQLNSFLIERINTVSSFSYAPSRRHSGTQALVISVVLCSPVMR